MTIRQAIKVLIRANRWRRGAEIEMTDPKEFGEAIDVAIDVMDATLVEHPGVEEVSHKAEEA